MGTADVPLLGDTIGENPDRAVRAFPERDALVDRPTARRRTPAELAAGVDAPALGLLDLGTAKGDRVGIWAPDRAEWTLTRYATARLGAILVTVNPAYRSHELEGAEPLTAEAVAAYCAGRPGALSPLRFRLTVTRS
ncbi:AMP-binding protein [Streptomyces sp. CBMA123]|uniref:AMP-binding protein n=1 Tax=Streptomyces sp. CBMA123 TaxID=1896313 RepID=UPI0016621B60|nr:hypothetical protein [Streptomyces sp. CBMA123]